jgi:GNAT superfamily N-acetyltransferase
MKYLKTFLESKSDYEFKKCAGKSLFNPSFGNKRSDVEFYQILINNNPIAEIEIKPKSIDDKPEILSIHSDIRGKGYGKILVDEILDIYLKDEVFVLTTKTSKPFWIRMGAKQVDKYLYHFVLKTLERADYDEIESDIDYLYVDDSQIPNAGKGLFTAIDIEKDEIISKYEGEILSEKEAKRRADIGQDQYFMNLPSGKILDCQRSECFARYANDASASPTKFRNNSFITMNNDGEVVLVSNRDIKSGEEIFTGYGRKYWRKHKF